MKPKGVFRASYVMCLYSLSNDLYMIDFVCRTDRSNSSASGSKQMPSNNRRFKIRRSRSLKIHSSIRYSICDRERSIVLFVMFVDQYCGFDNKSGYGYNQDSKESFVGTLHSCYNTLMYKVRNGYNIHAASYTSHTCSAPVSSVLQHAPSRSPDSNR